MIVPDRIRPPGPITVGSSPGWAPRGGTPTCAPGSMTVPSPTTTFGYSARSLCVSMRHDASGDCAGPGGRRIGGLTTGRYQACCPAGRSAGARGSGPPRGALTRGRQGCSVPRRYTRVASDDAGHVPARRNGRQPVAVNVEIAGAEAPPGTDVPAAVRDGRARYLAAVLAALAGAWLVPLLTHLLAVDWVLPVLLWF